MLQGGADVLPVRLRNVLLRILNRSLVKYRPSYIPASSWDKLLQHGVANGPSGGPPQPTTPDGQTSKMKDLMSPFSRGPAAGSPESATALSNAGNLYGLQVRPSDALSCLLSLNDGTLLLVISCTSDLQLNDSVLYRHGRSQLSCWRKLSVMQYRQGVHVHVSCILLVCVMRQSCTSCTYSTCFVRASGSRECSISRPVVPSMACWWVYRM